MLIINLSGEMRQISGGDAVALSMLGICIVLALVLWYARIKERRIRIHPYPTLNDAIDATDQQIITWRFSLPQARTTEQLETIEYICARYLQIIDGSCYQPVTDKTQSWTNLKN